MTTAPTATNWLTHLKEVVDVWRMSAKDYLKASGKAQSDYELGYLYGKVATREHDAEELEAALGIIMVELTAAPNGKRDLDGLREWRDTTYHVKQLLGTGNCKVNTCEGCEYERKEAVELIKQLFKSLEAALAAQRDPLGRPLDTPE